MTLSEVPVTPDALETEINRILALSQEEQLFTVVELANRVLESQNNGLADSHVESVRSMLVSLFESGVGPTEVRVAAGAALAELGDSRILTPQDADYWAPVPIATGTLWVGRHPVSSGEFWTFVNSGSYDDESNWSEEALGWKQLGRKTWCDLANTVHDNLLRSNQPVVGVNWYEASAYATSVGARLPTVMERLWVIRGAEKRPYPWGDPFGHGNANTKEEVVGHPCAIGLFRSDCTPDGVWDLAGNAAEWLEDEVGEQHVYHPGSWKQPSLASWAKARELRKPTHRDDDLGCRLVRDTPCE